MPATTESTPTMRFNEFREMALVSMEDLCREIFMKNQASIKTKKEAVAVRNLTNIFNTTLRLSNEKGFHTMSLRDLSRASGLSMGALYSYFTSKEELLEMIQDQGRRLVQRILRQQIKGLNSPEVKLRTGIRTHIYLTEVMQPWFYFSFMETKNLDKAQQKKSIEGELASEQIFIEILNEGLRQKVFRVAEPMLTAALIKAMMQDWYVKRWKYRRRSISVDEFADFVIRVVESILDPDSTKPAAPAV
jgi:AcrR family transcriptional regulator